MRNGSPKEPGHPEKCDSYESFHIPPLVSLGKLSSQSNRIVNQTESEEDLRDMFAPGSSLGGARPKAVVVDQNNDLLIAKFSSPKDEWNVELWEYLTFKMAKKAKIPVPDFELRNISGHHVLLWFPFRPAKQWVALVTDIRSGAYAGACEGKVSSYKC